MKIPLSQRLLTCCRYVTPGDRVADIGCDHGYLGIYLLTQGLASSVIASDINQGPLECAVRNSVKFGVSDNIRFYLSDGVRKIPRDFDTMVCAGMGGDVMISILEAAPWLRDSRYRLILQCQSRRELLRKYLSETGWQITEETVIRDGRFLYTVMNVVWQPGETLTPGQWYISPALLKNKDTELAAYYQWEVQHLRIAVNGQGTAADPEKVAALEELLHTAPDSIKEILS